MHEIELRFHVPADAGETLRAFVGGAPLALAAIYFDSADRQLARAGIGLRLRREGERWVQTVKGPAEDGISRLEHNAELEPGSPATLDLGRHAGHPLGERLRACRAELLPVFATDIQRRTRRLRVAGAEIELAWDEGWLLAGEQRLAVHELELELLAGSANALLAHAHGLVTALPLSLDLRSKAERGEALAAGLRQSPPRKARPLRLRPDMGPAAALRALLLNVFDQVAANASQIGSGSSQPGHLHQLRVGLRRLRSGLQLFRGIAPAHPGWPAFERQAAAWMRELGRLRDAELQAGLPLGDAAAPPDACAAVRQPAAQQLLIECLGWIHHLAEAEPGSAPALHAALRGRLRDWQRELQQDSRRFTRLDAEQRHRLRKRCKRLRYGLDFVAGLFDAAADRKTGDLLLAVQQRLGELNDVELALARLRQRQRALLKSAAVDVARLAKAPRLRVRPADVAYLAN